MKLVSCCLVAMWGCCILPEGLCTLCTGGQVFHECGSACDRTCEKQLPICTLQCESRCECPYTRPIWHANRCITPDKCSEPVVSEISISGFEIAPQNIAGNIGDRYTINGTSYQSIRFTTKVMSIIPSDSRFQTWRKLDNLVSPGAAIIYNTSKTKEQNQVNNFYYPSLFQIDVGATMETCNLGFTPLIASHAGTYEISLNQNPQLAARANVVVFDGDLRCSTSSVGTNVFLTCLQRYYTGTYHPKLYWDIKPTYSIYVGLSKYDPVTQTRHVNAAIIDPSQFDCQIFTCVVEFTAVDLPADSHFARNVPVYKKTCSLKPIDLNACLSHPCRHQGQCTDLVGNYNCTCLFGYSGKNCGIAPLCTDTTCLNGGTCVAVLTDFMCLCQKGYKGKICQEDFNECASFPCGVGATCVNLISTFSCICPAGKTGPNCSTSYSTDYCASSPCGASGLCLVPINFTSGYVCACLDRFYGTHCELSVNSSACSSNPCSITETCISNANGTYKCKATIGQAVDLSSYPNYCASRPCKHGGQCIQYGLNYICQCLEGYTGPDCENCEIAACASLICLLGCLLVLFVLQ